MRAAYVLKKVIPFCLAAIALCLGDVARAQFASPGETQIRERIQGTVLVGENAPTPEPGDQIGAFFEDEVIGVFAFSSQQDNPLDFEILLFGDDPATNPVEGPEVGDPVTFRFFDSSTNSVLTNVTPLNDAGEGVNLTFQGDLVPMIPGLPLDLTPTRGFDLRLGEGGADNGGGDDGDGDGGAPEGNPDVNNDGRVDKKDAALVVRIYISSARGVDEATAGRADVNGDGTVNTADAIAVLRASRDQ